MIDPMLKGLLAEYFKIVEKNIVKGHYFETDFRHYSQLVKAIVNEAGNDSEDKIYCTSLCLPLIQWFNFRIDPKIPTAKIVDMKRMQCDKTWEEYLRHAKETTSKLNIYRYLLAVDLKAEEVDEDHQLIPKEILEAHKNKTVILKKNDPLTPLTNSEIKKILTTFTSKYSCYDESEMAYLIVDEDKKNVNKLLIDKELYRVENLIDYFVTTFQKGNPKYKIFDPTTYISNFKGIKLPEDFFIIGTGKNINNASWQFGLAADVVAFKKVRLWFITKDISALEIDEKGEYRPRFELNQLDYFIKNHLVSA